MEGTKLVREVGEALEAKKEREREREAGASSSTAAAAAASKEGERKVAKEAGSSAEQQYVRSVSARELSFCYLVVVGPFLGAFTTSYKPCCVVQLGSWSLSR